MPYIKLTKASLANLTGQLPGKNFRGVDFKNGVSTKDLPLALADKFAAQLEGVMICEADGSEIERAGSVYRKTTQIPTPVVPRAPSVIPVQSTNFKTIVPDEESGGYILTAEDNGLFLDAYCDIAVTSDLPADFQVAIRRAGDDGVRIGRLEDDRAILIAAGDESLESLYQIPVRFGIVGIMRFPDGRFQITGQFSPVVIH